MAAPAVVDRGQHARVRGARNLELARRDRDWEAPGDERRQKPDELGRQAPRGATPGGSLAGWKAPPRL
jgi:hypothetical protein